MLEDDSGRIKLVLDPKFLEARGGLNLVTGVIMAALGLETSAGEFNVVDVCFAGTAEGVRASRDRLIRQRGKGEKKGQDKVKTMATSTSAKEDNMDVDGVHLPLLLSVIRETMAD